TNGSEDFSVTLKTSGLQSIIATDTVDSLLTATQGPITVHPAGAGSFTVSYLSSTMAGVAHNVSVTALDGFGNTDTNYAGTVHFTSTDGHAVLPSNSTLTNGTGSFDATLKTAGSRTITATDTNTSSINGASGAITVSSSGTTTQLA